jgi:hypothetical protein
MKILASIKHELAIHPVTSSGNMWQNSYLMNVNDFFLHQTMVFTKLGLCKITPRNRYLLLKLNVYYDDDTIKNQFHKHNCLTNKLISNRINNRNVTAVQEQFPEQ